MPRRNKILQIVTAARDNFPGRHPPPTPRRRRRRRRRALRRPPPPSLFPFFVHNKTGDYPFNDRGERERESGANVVGARRRSDKPLEYDQKGNAVIRQMKKIPLSPQSKNAAIRILAAKKELLLLKTALSADKCSFNSTTRSQLRL